MVVEVPLMTRLASSSLALEDLGPQAISNMLQCFATLQLLHFPVMHRMSSLALMQLSSFGSQEFANLVWSCATLIYVKVSLLTAMEDVELRQLSLRPSFNCTV
ncbi:Hypothetical protein SCF082_LOCUS42004 [Durusdinium trenchii]|uniref:Uncharacterized protein n=1 Tax=Durusdinium trenchii TaxID=1381693 RepID=A0ABP0QPS6_9DINO